MKTLLTIEQVRTARIVAAAADITQIVFAPIFIEGALSPFNDALDLAVCIILTNVIGWHWAFVPTTLLESFPGLDEFPTWTASVFYVTRDRQVLPENN